MPPFKLEWSWQSKPLGQPWHSILLAVFAAVLLWASAHDYMSTQRLVSSANRAKGVVTEVVQVDDMFYPRVSFFDDEGARHVFDSKLRSKPARYSAGETVVVLYQRQGSVEPRIESFVELRFVSLITAIIGGALGIAAALLWVFRHRLFEQYSDIPDKSRASS